MDHYAINLRHTMTTQVTPIEYAEAKRLMKQKDTLRVAMNDLTLDMKHFDVLVQMYEARANALDIVANVSTDLEVRLGCRKGAAEIREFVADIDRRIEQTKRHVQDLSEVLDL